MIQERVNRPDIDPSRVPSSQTVELARPFARLVGLSPELSTVYIEGEQITLEQRDTAIARLDPHDQLSRAMFDGLVPMGEEENAPLGLPQGMQGEEGLEARLNYVADQMVSLAQAQGILPQDRVDTVRGAYYDAMINFERLQADDEMDRDALQQEQIVRTTALQTFLEDPAEGGLDIPGAVQQQPWFVQAREPLQADVLGLPVPVQGDLIRLLDGYPADILYSVGRVQRNGREEIAVVAGLHGEVPYTTIEDEGEASGRREISVIAGEAPQIFALWTNQDGNYDYQQGDPQTDFQASQVIAQAHNEQFVLPHAKRVNANLIATQTKLEEQTAATTHAEAELAKKQAEFEAALEGKDQQIGSLKDAVAEAKRALVIADAEKAEEELREAPNQTIAVLEQAFRSRSAVGERFANNINGTRNTVEANSDSSPALYWGRLWLDLTRSNVVGRQELGEQFDILAREIVNNGPDANIARLALIQAAINFPQLTTEPEHARFVAMAMAQFINESNVGITLNPGEVGVEARDEAKADQLRTRAARVDIADSIVQVLGDRQRQLNVLLDIKDPRDLANYLREFANNTNANRLGFTVAELARQLNRNPGNIESFGMLESVAYDEQGVMTTVMPAIEDFARGHEIPAYEVSELAQAMGVRVNEQGQLEAPADSPAATLMSIRMTSNRYSNYLSEQALILFGILNNHGQRLPVDVAIAHDVAVNIVHAIDQRHQLFSQLEQAAASRVTTENHITELDRAVALRTTDTEAEMAGILMLAAVGNSLGGENEHIRNWLNGTGDNQPTVDNVVEMQTELIRDMAAVTPALAEWQPAANAMQRFNAAVEQGQVPQLSAYDRAAMTIRLIRGVTLEIADRLLEQARIFEEQQNEEHALNTKRALLQPTDQELDARIRATTEAPITAQETAIRAMAQELQGLYPFRFGQRRVNRNMRNNIAQAAEQLIARLEAERREVEEDQPVAPRN